MESSSHEMITAFYSQHFAELCSFIRKRMGDNYFVEDIAQDVFIKLLRPDIFFTPSSLQALVYKTASNLVIDQQRRLQCFSSYMKHCQRKGELSYNGESHYYAQEMTDCIERKLTHMTETECKIFRIYIYDEMNVKDISKVTQMKYKAVEYQLGKARKKMRQYLSPLIDN